ncbi:MAG: hypothetical protein NVSMB5_11810 [Candidatus Velthaea sp.]
MDHEQLELSAEILGVMRGAVSYAFHGGSDFVSPSHVLLALLDDARLGDVLGGFLEREKILADTKRVKLPGVVEIMEAALPAGEPTPFKRYDTLAFQSSDGKRVMWLDRESFKIFIEGARRVDAGTYRPKHLALGFVVESVKDPAMQGLLGLDPAAVTSAVHEMP